MNQNDNLHKLNLVDGLPAKVGDREIRYRVVHLRETTVADGAAAAMAADEQAAFLADMARLGQALLVETGAVRVNYAMFGNLEPALHAHLFPRRDEEPESFRTAQPWAWDWSRARAFDRGRDAALIEALRRRLAG